MAWAREGVVAWAREGVVAWARAGVKAWAREALRRGRARALWRGRARAVSCELAWASWCERVSALSCALSRGSWRGLALTWGRHGGVRCAVCGSSAGVRAMWRTLPQRVSNQVVAPHPTASSARRGGALVGARSCVPGRVRRRVVAGEVAAPSTAAPWLASSSRAAAALSSAVRGGRHIGATTAAPTPR